MTGAGRPIDLAPTVLADPTAAAGLRPAIVASRWHAVVMDGLLAGAARACTDAGVDAEVIRVPGSFELPVVVAGAVAAGYDPVVALGVVIRGGTPHFEYVCAATSDALARVAVDTGVAIGFGLLTCDTEEQALDRAGLPHSLEDKGYEATVSALETAAILRGVRRANAEV